MHACMSNPHAGPGGCPARAFSWITGASPVLGRPGNAFANRAPGAARADPLGSSLCWLSVTVSHLLVGDLVGGIPPIAATMHGANGLHCPVPWHGTRDLLCPQQRGRGVPPSPAMGYAEGKASWHLGYSKGCDDDDDPGDPSHPGLGARSEQAGESATQPKSGRDGARGHASRLGSGRGAHGQLREGSPALLAHKVRAQGLHSPCDREPAECQGLDMPAWLSQTWQLPSRPMKLVQSCGMLRAGPRHGNVGPGKALSPQARVPHASCKGRSGCFSASGFFPLLSCMQRSAPKVGFPLPPSPGLGCGGRAE